MTIHRIGLLRSREAAKAGRAPGRRAAVLAAAAAVGGGMWLTVPAASAATSHCLIINNAIDTSYTRLQAAQDAAAAGATLWVRGTCTGTTDISKNPTITGQHPRGFTAPTLDGGGQGSVLTIGSLGSDITVTINTLTITGGNSATIFDGGGGIVNFGTVTLNTATVSGNSCSDCSGGGIFNEGTLTLNDNATVSGNTASNDGGGIYNFLGSVTLNDNATISGNTASNLGGGIAILPGGTVTGAVANVFGNKPDNIFP
jgi:hypothetical protein